MAKTPPKIEFRTFGGPPDQLEVVGVKTSRVRDAYHFLLVHPWWVTIAVVGGVYLIANLVFATLFWLSGGIANARPGSFEDAFFFSVQTLGTLGYGAMYPQTTLANMLMTLESLASVMILALSTGIAFAKFARSDAKMLFSNEAVICPVNGVPHLMFRVANQRGHLVTSAKVIVAMIREERTAEGVQLYRLLDLKPIRDRHIAFTRTWTIMHRVDEHSPLHGSTPEGMVAAEDEIIISMEGIDATSAQPVFAQHSYLAREVIWGAQHVDLWINLPDGRARMDYGDFHRTKPSEPTSAFPYRGGKRVEV
jgi:inward rectifier potassium channel